MQLKIGTILQDGRYCIVKTLGNGGFGITYLAKHAMTDRMVCIKEFLPKRFLARDDNSSAVRALSKEFVHECNRFKAKFIKEAKTIANLDHPNIIHIYDAFEENGTAYYVMEYVDGESLSELVRRRGALTEGEAVKYIRCLAKALQYIHDRKIMHLDIKPGNIMLRKKDDNVILIDFGLAKHYDETCNEATSTTPVGVTHGYAPMEQYKEGGVSMFSPETDIYSLGATLYYLVTGATPPHAADVADDGLPNLPTTISAGIRTAIECAMVEKRKQRTHTIAEFLEPMSDVCDGVVDILVAAESTDEETVVAKMDSNATQINSNTPPNNEIWYTTSDDQVLPPQRTDVFGANIISNTFEDGRGIIKFDGSVTTIGNDAFHGCDNLASITIPNSVTKIGFDAFLKCPRLIGFEGKFAQDNGRCLVSDGVLIAFAPAGLTEYVIPDSVTTIGGGAFEGCMNLNSVTIPNSVTEIRSHAFFDCLGLQRVYCKATKPPKREDSAFKRYGRKGNYVYYNELGCIICVPGVSVELYKSAADWKWFKIVSDDANIYDDFKPIGDRLPRNNEIFYTTLDGKSLDIEEKLDQVFGEKIFDPFTLRFVDNMSNKKNVFGANICMEQDIEYNIRRLLFDGNVTRIGKRVFRDYKNLSSITIPDSVTEIGFEAFCGCTGLIEFKGKFAQDNGRCLVSDGVLIAFAPAGLTEYVIPNSVTTIGGGAFAGCMNLKNIIIPDLVTSIGDCAFYNCKSLTSIIIPDRVTKIGRIAFGYCRSLKSVYCKATTPPNIKKGLFSYLDRKAKKRVNIDCTIYVRLESVNAYRTAIGWKEYADQIVGWDFDKDTSIPLKTYKHLVNG